MKNSIFLLKDILALHSVSIAFISEPQSYQCDASQTLQYIQGEYCWNLNSHDVLDPELPLYTSMAYGGTLTLWQKNLDPYIEVVPTSTTSFLPIILMIPGLKTTIHFTLYLPTHGKDEEFISDLAELRNCLDNLLSRYTDPVLYIRGDGNVNPNNKTRVILLQQIIQEYNLVKIELGHKTYHHFVGNGMYDSCIDILLHSHKEVVTETVEEIICKETNPAVLSHHDPIVSTFTIPMCSEPQPKTNNVIAPKLEHTRVKILWTEKGKVDYCNLVQPYLRRVRDSWCDPTSKVSMSVLLSLTSDILTHCAMETNKSQEVGNNKEVKSWRYPKAVKLAKNKLSKAHKMFKNAVKYKSENVHSFKEAFIQTKMKFQKTIRNQRLATNMERYNLMDKMLTNPSSAHAFIRSCKKTKPKKIEKLTVGNKVYLGSAVCDGFYHSMTTLKQCKIEALRNDPNLSNQFLNYDTIVQLCKEKAPIPPIAIEKSTSILKTMKKSVSDYFSITALHYLYAGQEGLLHFHHLLNALISEVNNSSIEELNVAYGHILYKGHRKDKTSDRSYRTISSCPFLAKSIDYYLRSLYHTYWDKCQAPTQYQGSGSCHELASLIVTEVIQYSLYVSSKPVFILVLDAQSAFDRCLHEILCSELYKAGVGHSAIMYMDSRLANRRTVYEWDGTKMGPSMDVTGFEQGGVNSSDYYKLYNNEQLQFAQNTELGADIGSSVISAVGQADDVMLLSSDIYSLQLLVKLTEEYCQKYRVKLEPKKTKLLGYCNKSSELLVELAKYSNSITIDNVEIKFSSQAEHVGVIRSTDGNLPNVLHRIAEHKKALGAVMSAGLARGHSGSPAAALRVHQLHCLPVLFSGLASLVLNKAETRLIDSHYQVTIQNLQRLHLRTPRSIIFFLAGTLPGEAVLHIRQLALFSMICHLPNDPLHEHGVYALTSLPKSAYSWFHHVRDLSLQYCLPHPLELLGRPLEKKHFKKLVKLKVMEYWHQVLVSECSTLKSLRYFDPFKASLQHPHPMWTTTAGNSFESSKSTVLARMTSGRYRTEMMSRFWSSNRQGYCLLHTCQQVPEDLEHLLIICPALEHTRMRLHSLWCYKTVDCPPLHQLIITILGSSPTIQTKFILDSTSFPEIVSLRQALGNEIQDRVLYLTRTWAYAIHRQKLQQLGRWPGSKQDKNSSRTYKGPPNPITLTQPQSNGFLIAGDVTRSNANSLSVPAVGFGSACDIPAVMTTMQPVHSTGLSSPDVPHQPVPQSPAPGLATDHGRSSYYTTCTVPSVTSVRLLVGPSDNLFNQDHQFHYNFIYPISETPMATTVRDNEQQSLPLAHGWGDCGVCGGGGVPCHDGGSGRGGSLYQPALPSFCQQSCQMCAARSGHRGRCCGSVGSTLPSYSSSSMLLPCSVVEGTE